MASAIGAGLTNLVSGSRPLNAIARDGTSPLLRFFAGPSGKEPRLALLVHGIRCVLALAVGELNAVVTILTVLFFMCYTCVNASCATLVVVNDPTWRPTFNYHHWAISVIGAVLCVWMMLAITTRARVGGDRVLLPDLRLRGSKFTFSEVGDGHQGMKFQLARNVLMEMDLIQHTKTGVPNCWL